MFFQLKYVCALPSQQPLHLPLPPFYLFLFLAVTACAQLSVPFIFLFAKVDYGIAENKSMINRPSPPFIFYLTQNYSGHQIIHSNINLRLVIEELTKCFAENKVYVYIEYGLTVAYQISVLLIFLLLHRHGPQTLFLL